MSPSAIMLISLKFYREGGFDALKPRKRGDAGTVRAQLLTWLVNEDLSDLAALNCRLAAWVEDEYHHSPHRGIDGGTPLERWAMVGCSKLMPH